MKTSVLVVCILSLMTTFVWACPPAPGSSHPQPFATLKSAPFTAFTFDIDNMGWQQTFVGRENTLLTYETLFSNTPAPWTGTNGNPPGSIFQTAMSNYDQRAYWLGYYGAPAFLGDLADAYLQCDLYSTGNWATLANGAGGDDGHVYARWVISATCPGDAKKFDMFISRRAFSVDLNNFTGWQTFSIDLFESSFLRWPNAMCGTYDFIGVMQNYDQIGLYVFSGTDDVADIDGSAGTWLTTGDGISRLQHYGATASSLNRATWGVDNLTAGGNSVPTEAASMGKVKALFR